MRGFLGGVSVGALLAAGGLAMLSLSVPLPVSEPEAELAEDAARAMPEPAEHDLGETPQLPNGGATASQVPDSGQGRDADLVEVTPSAPAAANGPDDLNALAGADTSPASKPKVGISAGVVAAISPAPAEAPGLGQETSVSQPQAVRPVVPQAPGTESAVVASTEPAAEPEEPEAVPKEPTEQEEETAAVARPAAPAMPETVELPSASTVLAPDIGSAPQATTLPVISAVPAVPGPEDGADEGSAESEAGPAAEEPEQEALAPSIGTPVVPLTERDKPQAAGFESAAAPDQPPFTAYAEPFDNPEDRPLMSIVLIDEAGAVGAEALAEFPYPLSFAIDPEDPEAAAKMAARRAAGFEVLMLADLPRAASPQDAETALEVWRGKLPEAVAILEGIETGVQGNRRLADQVAAVAASVGYGLVTQNSGLNTVQKLALRDGVPAGVVFRDFDGAGQNPRAIRRFLDQAAFRAGQEGAVIMLGRLRPDTISALLIWGLQDRAERVALAPVSASLEAQLPEK